jgi:hypothetical protein
MSVKVLLLALLVTAFAYFVVLVPRIESADSTVVPRTGQESSAEE